MPTNLILRPLLGGYWFLHAFYFTRFRSQRLDGYRLLVESALVGVILLALARPLAALLNKPFFFLWSMIAPTDIPFLGTACISLVLGLGLPYGLNYVLAKRNWTILDAKTKAIERHGNDLLRLLHAASLEEKTVSISLDTGKVYVGLVAATPNLAPHDTYLGLTPFYSGYRDKETHTLAFTVDYLDAYETHGLDPEDFRVVLPIANIRVASFFDHTAYPKFIVESEVPEADSAAR